VNFFVEDKKISYPCLIISNDVQNQISKFLVVLPIVISETLPKVSFHVEVILGEKKAVIITERIHYIHKDKLANFLEKLNQKAMAEVEKALVSVLKISSLK
jgi:mRNA-degrading endonuclease toxin of MazEF toxin-antitoxin module